MYKDYIQIETTYLSKIKNQYILQQKAICSHIAIYVHTKLLVNAILQIYIYSMTYFFVFIE